jgi:ABC-type lipoprotein release transport system permease subunit
MATGPAPADDKAQERFRRKEARERKTKDSQRRRFFAPLFSQSPRDLILYSMRDARASTVSLASNVFAILLGTFLTAMLLALLAGTEQYIRHLFRTIPGIDSVHVWVDYSTGESPMTDDEAERLSNWPGARMAVPNVNQFVPLFQKPTREVIASLFSTQKGDPEVERLQLVAGSREVETEGWDVILPMRLAEEINNFNPEGLVGATITLQLRRYEKTARMEGAKPSEKLNYPARVVGIVQASPQDRAYGSLAMVRFVRDFSTGRSDYAPAPGGRVELNNISARTMNEGLRIHFGGAAEAENAFLQMKQGGTQRFEASWPGERMLYLRDVETISTIVLIGIGLLSIVAGAVSIFNTLLASVARKTKEIGIMRALGVTRPDIFLIFLMQSIIIGILACVVGLIITGIATYPLNAYVTQRWGQLAEAMKAIGGLFQFGLPVALSLVGAVLGICLVAAFLPALRASSKTPMDALREQ